MHALHQRDVNIKTLRPPILFGASRSFLCLVLQPAFFAGTYSQSLLRTCLPPDTWPLKPDTCL